MRSVLALSLLAVARFAAAQDTPQQNYPYTIDPESVPESDRTTWCDNQKAQCPYICTQLPGVETTTTQENECDPDALTYSCICDNGAAPNITQYSQTLPYYICTEWGNQCVKDCGRDSACADSCRADHPCGAQEPPKGNASVSAAMSSAALASKTAADQAAKTSIPVDGFGGTQPTDSPNNKNSAPALVSLGQTYGLAVVIGGIVAGFAVML